MSLPEQKSLTNEQLRQFCEYNFDWEWMADMIGCTEVVIQDVALATLDPTVILDWIRDNLEPSDIWDMDEYDSALIREYVSIGNERAYDAKYDR